jgi:hypothetical protein
MTLAEFQDTLSQPNPPAGRVPAVTALWWAAKNDWDKAHKLVMDEGGEDCAWVHAYLHRVEGDNENADYWYRQAGKPAAKGPLQAEWDAIATELLEKPSQH